MARYLSTVLSEECRSVHVITRVCICRRKLGRLTSCYERVFTHHCGATGGRLLADLMSRAFADPHYQRYRYRPDCRLHRRRPTLPTTTPSSDDRQRCGSKSSASGLHPVAVIIATFIASTLALVSCCS